jgi:predicted transcriptional regulator
VSKSKGLTAVRFPDETRTRIAGLAKDMGMSRSAVTSRLVEGALRDSEGVERWKDAVLGPRFAFDAAPPRHRSARRIAA